jgi:hypothetical protein
MKNILSFTIAIFISLYSYSQDTIVKYNGSTIFGKVLEIGATEVKYKKADFIDGPTYVELKSEIEMIKYRNGVKEHFEKTQLSSVSQNNSGPRRESNSDYYGGHVDSKNKIEVWGVKYRYKDMTISERELRTMLMQSKDKKIISLIQKAKDNNLYQYVGFFGIPFGMAAGYCLLESQTRGTYNPQTGSNTNPDQNKYISLAATFAIIAIACPITSGVCKHNRTISTQEAIKLYNEKY